MAKMTMVEALNLAMRQEMEKDDRVVVLGEDVGVDGGVFRVTDGLLNTFGEERVVDTPLAESGIIGTSIGMAVYGLRPICEIQFSGFSYYIFHQLEAHATRLRHRSQGRFQVPLVVRAPCGGGVRALEHHSESREAYYAHTPGVKMVIPSGPRNARALLVSAIRDPDPVVFFEPKALYRAFREEVPEEEEALPLGQPQIAREGEDVTIIAYGAMIALAMDAADELQEKHGIAAEIIDLLTISPLQDNMITDSVKKTGRAVVVHEAPRSFGPGAEIISRIIEKSFYYLEAPVKRVTGYDIVYPLFAREEHYMPDVGKIIRAVQGNIKGIGGAMLQNFTLPDLGEGIHEGEILEVAISPGDEVKEGDVILVVETDKAAVEIPSPYTGIVEEVHVKAHDVVKVGSVMVVFQLKEKEGKTQKHEASITSFNSEKTVTDPKNSRVKKGPVPASPATRKLARELAVDLSEITGSGPAGLVTADDVRSFAQAKSPESIVPESTQEAKEKGIAPPSESVQLPDFSRWGDVEIVPLQSIRRAIARKMSLSWSQIPHVSHQELADITELEKIRQKNKVEVEEHGGKLTLTVFALKAIFAALEAFPRFNASLDSTREEIILKKYYNLGIATDTERGLLVPVIRDVGKKSMLELAIELPQITEKARQGKLTIDESTGGTFTITNIGGIGGTGFTPIINFPQVAILGLGKARWQPVVCENNKGEQDIVPRRMLPLVLSFDHRVLDGAEGAHFANHVKETLENPARILFFEQ